MGDGEPPVDDDPPWCDIIWSGDENGNILGSAVSSSGDSALPTPPFLATPHPILSTSPPCPATPVGRPNSLLNRRVGSCRISQGGTPFPIVSDIGVRTPDTSSLQHRMAEFTTAKPE